MIKNTTTKGRKIKLQPQLRSTGYANRQKVVPSLRLSGLWMEDLGFKPGDVVSITTRERLLIIEPLKDEEQEHGEWKKRLTHLQNELKELKQWK